MICAIVRCIGPGLGLLNVCIGLHAGSGNLEKSYIPWRISSDLNLICHEKKLCSVADFIHKCCAVHGVATVELLDHEMVQKEYPPVPCCDQNQNICIKQIFGFRLQIDWQAERHMITCTDNLRAFYSDGQTPI